MKREMIKMSRWPIQFSSGRRARFTVVSSAILAVGTITGAYPGLAQSAQPTFHSIAEASQSLFEAVQTNNQEVIEKILGGPTELASSRDDNQDRVDRELFVEKYREMHRLSRNADGSVTL